MLRMMLIAGVILVTGCASTRDERAAAFATQLPELVAACNAWRQSDVADGRVVRGRGLEACSRLRDENSLQLADASAAGAYLRFLNTPSSRVSNTASAGFAGPPYGAPTPILGPGGAPQ